MASTAMPAPIVAAGIASLKIVQENPEMRIRLLEKARKLKEEIIRLGFQTTLDCTPILPIMLSKSSKAKDLSLFLEKNGIIVPYMNYPVKQAKFIVRITVSARHTVEQTELLLEMIKKWGEKNGTN